MAKEAIAIEAAGREVRLSSPSKVYFPAPRWTKRDLAEYYLAVADAACLHLRERPTTMKRFVDGAERRVLLPEAGSEDGAGLARDGDGPLPERPQRDRALRQRRRAPGLGGQPRGDRLQPLAGAPRRPRPPRRAARRPRPDPGGRLRRGARGRAASSARCSPTTACSASRRPRDRAGSTSTSGSSRAGASPRSGGRRSRLPARSSAGRRSWRPRSGGRRSATGCSSTTTRTPAIARSPRPTRCGRSPTPASRPRSSGTRCADADPAELRLDTVPARLAERGDPAATIDEVPTRSTRCSSSPTRRGRGPRRRPLAAALPQAGGRAEPGPAEPGEEGRMRRRQYRSSRDDQRWSQRSGTPAAIPTSPTRWTTATPCCESPQSGRALRRGRQLREWRSNYPASTTVDVSVEIGHRDDSRSREMLDPLRPARAASSGQSMPPDPLRDGKPSPVATDRRRRGAGRRARRGARSWRSAPCRPGSRPRLPVELLEPAFGAGLSSRQRSSFAPWRIRPALTWSKLTSTTSSGRRSTHSRSRSADQRLGSAEPRSPVSYGARVATSSRFSAAFRPEVWPTTRSSPSPS